MPTDVAFVLLRKMEAEEEAKASLMIVCLWSALGLVLTRLLFNLGFGPELAQVLLAAE